MEPTQIKENTKNAQPKVLPFNQWKSRAAIIPVKFRAVHKFFTSCTHPAVDVDEEDNSLFCTQLSKYSLPSLHSPQKQTSQKLKMSVQTCMIPHPEKVKKGGEDAFFVSEDSKALGVADGVGGWADKGIDASLYSKTLMSEAKKAHDELSILDPRETLKIAATKANRFIGSSTACILSIDDSDKKHIKLKSANLGDSGFLLIRDGTVVYRTKEQQFSFNFPYQLGSTSRATPGDAEVASNELHEHDIIIMGTDGLFDNLFDQEIIEHLSKCKQDASACNNASSSSHEIGKTEFNVAEILAMKAYDKSRSSYAKTPFSKHAKEHGLLYPGGKMDDITVLVAVIVSADDTEQPATELKSDHRHSSGFAEDCK